MTYRPFPPAPKWVTFGRSPIGWQLFVEGINGNRNKRTGKMDFQPLIMWREAVPPIAEKILPVRVPIEAMQHYDWRVAHYLRGENNREQRCRLSRVLPENPKPPYAWMQFDQAYELWLAHVRMMV